MSRSITLCCVDPHPLILSGMKELFAAHADFQLLAACADGAGALAALKRQAPMVLVTELHLPDVTGITFLQTVRAQAPEVRVVLYTAALDEREALQATRNDVAGVVLKEMAPEMLIRCIRKVAAGGHWIEKRSYELLLGKALQRESAARSLGRLLTGRELEIARLVAEGRGNHDIGTHLGIGIGTIKTHLHSVYRKLGLQGRAQLMLYVQRQGLV